MQGYLYDVQSTYTCVKSLAKLRNIRVSNVHRLV
jgi:hypothetical protein